MSFQQDNSILASILGPMTSPFIEFFYLAYSIRLEPPHMEQALNLVRKWLIFPIRDIWLHISEPTLSGRLGL